MDFLVKSMLEMNDRMKRFEDSLKRLEEEKGTTHFQSVVTVEERKSISDITTQSQNFIDYFKNEKGKIGKCLKVVILQNTFARTKFLYDKREENTPTAAEKVVLKAIEIKQIKVPLEFTKCEFVREAAGLVKQQYNIIWSQVTQNLQKRWFGKF